MKAELPKPLAVGGVVLLVVLVLAGGFFLLKKATQGDLDGQVVHPKPWGPPGGAGAFKVHGAPQTQQQGAVGTATTGQ
jgi:hypothetical protein